MCVPNHPAARQDGWSEGDRQQGDPHFKSLTPFPLHASSAAVLGVIAALRNVRGRLSRGSTREVCE